MLIIWDFDGVICDSDYLWADNWQKLLLQEKKIKLSEDDVKNLLIGISEKDKKAKLEQHFSNLTIDDSFMEKLNQLHDYGMKNLLTLTPGVEEIFKDTRFKQCIATGGNDYQNKTKNHAVGIDKYFDSTNCFTADMVSKGKPEPDLFLLAAKQMKTPVTECIVIEDAISGIRAAKSAGMKCFAFVGAKANNNPEYREKCLSFGADQVFEDMKKLHKTLLSLNLNPLFYRKVAENHHKN